MHFRCIQCGLCCRMLKLIPALSDYDDGNGVCRYLKNNLCDIYKDRPLICNVEAMYTAFFKDAMDEDTFIRENLNACLKLSKQFGDKKNQHRLKQLMLRKDLI